LLTHAGAGPGARRTTPPAYYDLGSRTFVVAGNSGSAQHPAWYHNVVANTGVIVEKDGDR